VKKDVCGRSLRI